MPARDRTGALDTSAAKRSLARRAGPVLGALGAAAVSAGLVYWISTSDEPSLSRAGPRTEATPPVVHAAGRADAGQVVRALDQMQEIYAEQGLAGVVRFDRACAESLGADPGALDFCLAFDMFAAALAADDDSAALWFAQAGARELDLTRRAVPPGVDPQARLSQVRALARQASLSAAKADATSASAPETPSAVATPAPAAANTSVASARNARARPVRGESFAACRARATPAQRTVCASPALREADRRMRRAYRRALAAGANPRRLARSQARWRASVSAAAPNRAAVARLYYKRTRELEAAARPKRSSRD